MRVRLESRLDDLDEELDITKGIARLKLQKKRDRVQYMLDWQGANPKMLDLGELREVITQPLHDDAVEDTYRSKIKNQKTAMRAYCVTCQGGSVVGVKECPSVNCPIFPFRMGKDPFRGFDLPKVEELEIEAIDGEEEFEAEDDEEDDSSED